MLEGVYGMISLKDVIKKNNNNTEPLVKNAMIPVLSDNSEQVPPIFRQAQDSIFYACSTQKRYNNEIK